MVWDWERLGENLCPLDIKFHKLWLWKTLRGKFIVWRLVGSVEKIFNIKFLCDAYWVVVALCWWKNPPSYTCSVIVSQLIYWYLSVFLLTLRYFEQMWYHGDIMVISSVVVYSVLTSCLRHLILSVPPGPVPCLLSFANLWRDCFPCSMEPNLKNIP